MDDNKLVEAITAVATALIKERKGIHQNFAPARAYLDKEYGKYGAITVVRILDELITELDNLERKLKRNQY